MHLIGEAQLMTLFNDGNKGTGTSEELAIHERTMLAIEGIVIASLDIIRPKPSAGPGQEDDWEAGGHRLRARIRVTTRGMWVDEGRLLQKLHQAAEMAIGRLSPESPLGLIERNVVDALRRVCKGYNSRRPEVIVIAHEMDPRIGAVINAQANRLRQQSAEGERGRGGRGRGGRGGGRGSPDRGAQRGAPPASQAPPEMLEGAAQTTRETLPSLGRAQTLHLTRRRASRPAGLDGPKGGELWD
eukprot:CAMPEP_0117691068 /NCGR_PEP_ID=MMETSP0804-20121206/25497_1 /TAXON_ID=1074897 /ORGANISM="Tetraselmis astigmatica, Strain CCMP880" /LENGTH=242 /DNA_ID=CAMNT_0005504225 /DNA_START=75 /DNA_END=804 /DNA_ORIENTATION=+